MADVVAGEANCFAAYIDTQYGIRLKPHAPLTILQAIGFRQR